jgi:two-component system repressor protein LuxO
MSDMAPARVKPGPVLLIEDMPSLQLIYRAVLTGAGHDIRLASSAAEGMALFTQTGAQVVLLDLGLPDRNGLDLMADMIALRPDTRVVIITANGSINKAVEAMRAGAFEFLVKPFDEARILNAVENAVERTKPARPAVQDRARGGFIGSSEAMARIHAKITSVANSMATVFITGESGTGKELCALAVHAASPRSKGPFIALNCGAIPIDLLESEVFGHVKGSFTGAISDKPGAATAADGGTLFLDEICASCRPRPCCRWGPRGRSRSMSASSVPPTVTPWTPCAAASSARICITASSSCRSTCPPCASGPKT